MGYNWDMTSQRIRLTPEEILAIKNVIKDLQVNSKGWDIDPNICILEILLMRSKIK